MVRETGYLFQSLHLDSVRHLSQSCSQATRTGRWAMRSIDICR
jgi:hypothetical protein